MVLKVSVPLDEDIEGPSMEPGAAGLRTEGGGREVSSPQGGAEAVKKDRETPDVKSSLTIHHPSEWSGPPPQTALPVRGQVTGRERPDVKSSLTIQQSGPPQRFQCADR